MPNISTVEDYRQAKHEILELLEAEPQHAPILIRLAWHDAGTYDAETRTGGPHGTMRFAPVSEHGANAGLSIARSLLQPIKDRHPNISYADLWSLGGVTAVEVTGGPQIPWRAGRQDTPEGFATPDGRLPDASQGPRHLRDIFHRMGLTDQDIVALSGAHKLGGCHTDRSGFKGNWSLTPLRFNNGYYRDLLSLDWEKMIVPETGLPQYWNHKRGIMMLNTDVCLLEDEKFRPLVELYAKDKDRFYADFSLAFSKLLELGVEDSLVAMDL